MWCNTFVQLDPIAAGILMAVLLKGEIPRLSKLARAAMMVAGITALALGSLYFGIKNDPLTTMRIVLGLSVGGLGRRTAVAFGVANSQRAVATAVLIYLGRISYGLYVFHVLGLLISDYTVPDQTASLFRYSLRVGVALAATIAMAAISYRWLETPFLSLKQRFTHVLSRPGG